MNVAAGSGLTPLASGSKDSGRRSKSAPSRKTTARISIEWLATGAPMQAFTRQLESIDYIVVSCF